MKILCDVCGKEEASVFCCADEAALCFACDRRVHRANSLAGEHRSLLLFAQSLPACDICQEKPGFFFCQEDRAILCSDCDASVHSANHLTMKHNRFLITGVRLSAAPISSPSTVTEAAAKAYTNVAVPISNQNKALAVDDFSPIASTNSATATTTTSSISEYLIKMCPGWRVEDLLVDEADAAMEGLFSKGDELLAFVEADIDGGRLEVVAEKFPQLDLPAGGCVGAHYQPWIASKEDQQGGKAGREPRSGDAFMVPQISSASTPSNKRPRHSLWYH